MASVTSSNGQNHDRLTPDRLRTSMSRTHSGQGGDDVSGHDITAAQKMISAMSGSLLTSLLVTPLDVVRVRLQSQKAPSSTADFSKLARTTSAFSSVGSTELGVTACCREVFFAANKASICYAAPRMGAADAPVLGTDDCAVREVRKKTYSSTLDGLQKIARNEGVTTLWRGLSPTLVMTIPANIIYFTGYDWLRYSHSSPFSGLSPDNAPLISGSVARVLAATAVGPIELVRTRMQAASHVSGANHLLETFQGIREMVGVQGYTALWRGLSLTLWRDVPFSGIYWWGYESLRTKLTHLRDSMHSSSTLSPRHDASHRERHGETFIDSFTAGALSGAFASIITTPFDVGKTRTQVYRDAAPPRPAANLGDAAGATRASIPPEQGNIMRLLWHIFKTEGAAGLWKGWIPRTLKVAPACAIMISSYEVGKRVFRSINERADRGHGEEQV